MLGRNGVSSDPLTALRVPLFHMDSLIWRPDWTEAPEHTIRAALLEIEARNTWVVEGWIDSYSMQMLQRADLIVYLDYPGWLAALGGVQRWWKHRARERPELPRGCLDRLRFEDLTMMLLRKERPHIEALLFELQRANIVRVTSRGQADALLIKLAAQDPAS